MERNRHDHVRRCHGTVAGADHPLGHHGCKVGAITVFQAMHEVADDPFVNGHRSQPVEDRRIGNGLRRNRALARIVGEGQARTSQ